jgi:hypothetical protein
LLHNIYSRFVFSGELQGLPSPLGTTYSSHIPTVCLKDPQAKQKKMANVPTLKFQILKVKLIARTKNPAGTENFSR